jgi:hypothetical protein
MTPQGCGGWTAVNLRMAKPRGPSGLAARKKTANPPRRELRTTKLEGVGHEYMMCGQRLSYIPGAVSAR